MVYFISDCFSVPGCFLLFTQTLDKDHTCGYNENDLPVQDMKITNMSILQTLLRHHIEDR